MCPDKTSFREIDIKTPDKMVSVVLNLERSANLFRISLVDDHVGTYEAKGTDYFDCFQKLRAYLEKENVLCLCQGARINVFPSGMMRQMQDGLIAYVLEIGSKPAPDDFVPIFSKAAPEEIVPVAEQRAFFDEWKRSLNPSPLSDGG